MFIRLKEHDTDKVHRVNIVQIDSYKDGEIWIRGRRYKVSHSADDIDRLIDEALGVSDPDFDDLFFRVN